MATNPLEPFDLYERIEGKTDGPIPEDYKELARPFDEATIEDVQRYEMAGVDLNNGPLGTSQSPAENEQPADSGIDRKKAMAGAGVAAAVLFMARK